MAAKEIAAPETSQAPSFARWGSSRRIKRDAQNPKRLLRWTRSVWHRWLLRIASAAGATLLAAAPFGGLLGVSSVAVLAGIAFVVLVGCVIGAVLTRPVRENHHEGLSATAESLTYSLTQAFSDYGDEPSREEGFRKRAFRAHYPRLAARLEAWDQVREAAGNDQVALSDHLDADMAERGIGDGYDTQVIKAYAHADAIQRAEGKASLLPALQWGRATTAGTDISGPAYGVLTPNAERDWITLPPTPGESREAWDERADEAIERVERFLREGPASAEPRAKAYIEAKRRAEARKHDEVPALREALRLIQDWEAPRARPRRCESC